MGTYSCAVTPELLSTNRTFLTVVPVRGACKRAVRAVVVRLMMSHTLSCEIGNPHRKPVCQLRIILVPRMP